jgi:hypothetical protein
MKRLIALVTAAATLSGLSAFAQGNFAFSSGPGFVWNSLNAPAVRGGPFNVGFLWSANLSATSAVALATGHSLIPTNNVTGGGAQGTAYNPTGDEWTAIMSDPNFQFGRNAGQGNAFAVATLTLTGGITYNGGSPFGVTGTSTGGGQVRIFFVAWSNAFADPAAAAAAGSVLGWSNPFNYSYGDTATAPLPMGTQAVNGGFDARFGVAPVPEPTTFALAGLGAAALMIFRRRK